MARKSSVHEHASLFGDAVFSASDGIVTTFAIVAGSAGASLGSDVVLILGFANLFADGLSMASGNYLGTKSEMEYEKVHGDGEEDVSSPFGHGLVTFVAFILAGLLPLVPFLFNVSKLKFELSALIVSLSLFAIGLSRGKYTKRNWFESGIEMLFVGGFAALAAYTVGFLLDKFVV